MAMNTHRGINNDIDLALISLYYAELDDLCNGAQVFYPGYTDILEQQRQIPCDDSIKALFESLY